MVVKVRHWDREKQRYRTRESRIKLEEDSPLNCEFPHTCKLCNARDERNITFTVRRRLTHRFFTVCADCVTDLDEDDLVLNKWYLFYRRLRAFRVQVKRKLRNFRTRFKQHEAELTIVMVLLVVWTAIHLF